MKVALVQCPVWGTREPPLGIVQLSGCLKSAGHEVRSFDLNNYLYRKRAEELNNLWAWEQSLFWYQKDQVRKIFDGISSVIDGYIDNILSFNPGLVGFSLASSSFWASVELSRRLKEKKKDIKIVYGGQLFYDKKIVRDAFSESNVDYIIIGEGDVTGPKLASMLEAGQNPSSCEGLCFKSGEGLYYTPERTLIKNFDDLPYMDFTDLKIDDYDDNQHISIMSSRGCVWNCAFCSSRSFWKGYREMSAERLHQEVIYQMMTHRGAGHIDFQDLVFNANIERVREFCRLMIDYPPFGHHKIKWLANAIVNPKMTKEVLVAMAQAGCKKLIFGIESGSQRVLGLMGKNYKVEDARRIIKDASEAGIAVTTNFMFGFPGETEEDFNETLKFIEDVGPYLERVYPSRTYCAIEENSEMYNNPSKYGIRTPFNHHLYWESMDKTNTYPVRLKRCQRFEEQCSKFKVQVDCGVKTSVEMDEWFNLGHYYENCGDATKALEYFAKYANVDPSNEIVSKKIKALQNS